MNKEMILKVADAIEFSKLDNVIFNMAWLIRPFDEEDDYGVETQGHTCGTACCIAGYTLVCNGGDRTQARGVFHPDDFIKASEYLGLDYNTTGYTLFFARGSQYEDELAKMPAWYAVKTLRHLAETGEVVWFDDEDAANA